VHAFDVWFTTFGVVSTGAAVGASLHAEIMAPPKNREAHAKRDNMADTFM
jgi:hypothetical protein